MKFTEFGLSEPLQNGIDALNFTSCTDVQSEVLPLALAGKDIYVQSQTGTGKTAAFLVSLYEIMEKSSYREYALIIVPTRELAIQIEKEAKVLGKFLNYRVAACYGGVGYEEQERALALGVEILVGTPGRLLDLCQKRILPLDKYHFTVIDEADRMFDMGFYQDIRRIFRALPPKEYRQTMLFSATMSYKVQQLASDFMKTPATVTIRPEIVTVEKITQKLYHVNKKDKLPLLLGIIRAANESRVLVFSNTKQMCEEIAGRLFLNGIDAAFLTGDLPQKKREKIIEQFKNNKLHVLIATDVAARGIHIEDLDRVVNFDIPQDCENYVHRIGRTARAGKSGTAITFACEQYVEFLEPVEKLTGSKIPSLVAHDDDYGTDVSTKYNWRSAYKKHREQSPHTTHTSNGNKSKKKTTRTGSGHTTKENMPQGHHTRVIHNASNNTAHKLSPQAKKHPRGIHSSTQDERQSQITEKTLKKEPGIFKKLFNFIGK